MKHTKLLGNIRLETLFYPVKQEFRLFTAIFLTNSASGLIVKLLFYGFEGAP